MAFVTRFAAMGIVVGGSLLASCRATEEPSADAYVGTMRSSCAPHDASATAFFLESADGDASVSFNLWPPGGVSLPAAIEFDADHPIGQAEYCTSPGTCEPATWGEIAVEGAADSAGVRGEWALGLMDGRVYRGTFVAEWPAIQALCG
jgi:hypothetical protein